MKKQDRYQVHNWREYNEALVRRGSVTFWIEEAALAGWYRNERQGKPGAPTRYSNMAIQMALVVREVFHLPLRALEGFLGSILALMRLELRVPDFSTFGRRQKRLPVAISKRVFGEPISVAIDSSGLKVLGEGEWKSRLHGTGRRRTWRKLHLAVDPDHKQVIACELTTNFVGDGEALPELLIQVEEAIAEVFADGAYDTKACHQAIAKRQAQALIPPREGAVPWGKDPNGQLHPRDQLLQQIQQQGRKTWKQTSGYHRRSLAENAFFRLKTLFGERLKNRHFQAQCTEAYCRVATLNRMTAIGMPLSVSVTG